MNMISSSEQMKDKKVIYNYKKQPVAIVEAVQMWRVTKVNNGLLDVILGALFLKDKEMMFDSEEDMNHWIAGQR